MPLGLKSRQEYFKKLLAEKEPSQTKKIFYKEQPDLRPVYRIDMDYLIFNQHNGRLESEMLTWQR